MVLYRTENYEGSGVRNTRDVIEYEIGDLGNTDIIEYVAEHYANRYGAVLLNKYSREIQKRDGDDIDDIAEEVTELIIRILADKFGKAPKYALWLAEKDVVINDYYGTENDISAYRIPKKSVVLSDLGSDGVLIGYYDKPENFKL